MFKLYLPSFTYYGLFFKFMDGANPLKTEVERNYIVEDTPKTQTHYCKKISVKTINVPSVSPTFFYPPPPHFYFLGNLFCIDTGLLRLLPSFFLSNPFCSQPFFFLQFASFLSSNTAEKVFRCEYLNKLYVPVFLLLIFLHTRLFLLWKSPLVVGRDMKNKYTHFVLFSYSLPTQITKSNPPPPPPTPPPFPAKSVTHPIFSSTSPKQSVNNFTTNLQSNSNL